MAAGLFCWPLSGSPTGLVFFGTITKRKTKHIYVGNWFYGAFIVVTAMLHIVNHISLPVGSVQVLLGLLGRGPTR